MGGRAGSVCVPRFISMGKTTEVTTATDWEVGPTKRRVLLPVDGGNWMEYRA